MVRAQRWRRIADLALGRPQAISNFDAFLSYSRSADGEIAAALQKRIERFAKPWYVPRQARIFRDATTLTGSAGLWESIVDGLQRSQWLIVLGSPAAAKSDWVNREVRWWREHRSTGSVLVVLTAGDVQWVEDDFDVERSSAIPHTLRGSFNEEPRWIDLRAARVSGTVDEADPLWADGIAEIAATIRGVDKDVLVGDHIREQRRTVRWVRSTAITLVLLLLLTVAGAAFAWNQRTVALTQTQAAEADLALARADQVRSSDPSLAAQLSVIAQHIDPSVDTRSAVIGTQGTPLSRILTVPPATPQDHLHARATTSDGSIIYSDTFAWAVMNPATGHSTPVLRNDCSVLAADASGDVVAVPQPLPGHLVEIYRLRGTDPPLHLGSVDPGRSGVLRALSLSPSGNRLAAIGSDRLWRSWDIHDPSRPAASPLDVAPLAGQASTIAFSPDGRGVAIGGGSGALALWSLRPDGGLSPLASLTGTVGSIAALAFSPDGRLLASGGEDRAIHIWFTAAPDRAVPIGKPLLGHQGGVTHLIFTRSGNTLVSGSDDTTLRRWDISDLSLGTPAGQILVGHTQPISALAELPNDSLISSDGAGISREWSNDRGIIGRAGAVRFQADGRALVAGIGASPQIIGERGGFAGIVPLRPDGSIGALFPLHLPGIVLVSRVVSLFTVGGAGQSGGVGSCCAGVA